MLVLESGVVGKTKTRIEIYNIKSEKAYITVEIEKKIER